MYYGYGQNLSFIYKIDIHYCYCPDLFCCSSTPLVLEIIAWWFNVFISCKYSFRDYVYIRCKICTSKVLYFHIPTDIWKTVSLVVNHVFMYQKIAMRNGPRSRTLPCCMEKYNYTFGSQSVNFYLVSFLWIWDCPFIVWSDVCTFVYMYTCTDCYMVDSTGSCDEQATGSMLNLSQIQKSLAVRETVNPVTDYTLHHSFVCIEYFK